MDRLIYTAMSGARSLLDRQATVANNLANVGTAGFRADVSVFRAVPVALPSGGAAMPTRESVLDSTPRTDFSTGPIMETGRALDIAVQGRGWIAVEAADGSEVYTRAGSLQVTADGVLQTRSGQNVLSDSGAIAVPPDTSISIARDGTVSAVPTRPPLAGVTTLGRIKLVDPDDGALAKGSDGLFRLRDAGTAQASDNVSVTSGALEGSNVNAAEAMVSMIALARQFEMQMKLMQNGEENDRQATQLLAAGG